MGREGKMSKIIMITLQNHSQSIACALRESIFTCIVTFAACYKNDSIGLLQRPNLATIPHRPKLYYQL